MLGVVLIAYLNYSILNFQQPYSLLLLLTQFLGEDTEADRVNSIYQVTQFTKMQPEFKPF